MRHLECFLKCVHGAAVAQIRRLLPKSTRFVHT